MPGGIQVFARALGMTTKELLKASEEGKLIASEVLPLVAIEMAKTARNNDALNKSLRTSRSQWTMFVSQFKMLFDGLGSTVLDRGVGRFIQALKSLIQILKPVLQLLFGLVGIIFSLAGEIGKGILSAFSPWLNILKMFEDPLKMIKEGILGVDTAFFEWVGHLSKFAVFLHPVLAAIALIGGTIEEVLNIFTGKKQGILAGVGDTVSERMANGMLGRLVPIFNVWWDTQFMPNFRNKANEMAQAISDALKSILPDWMFNFVGGSYNQANDLANKGTSWLYRSAQSTAQGIDSLFSGMFNPHAPAAQVMAPTGVDYIPKGNDALGVINVYVDGKKTMEQVFDKKTQQDLIMTYEE